MLPPEGSTALKATTAHAEPSVPTRSFKTGDLVVINGNLTGIVAYVGRPKGSDEQLAGVQLLGLSVGCGDSDGSLHGERFFTCEPMNAVFVPLDRLSERPTSRMDKIQLNRALMAEQERVKAGRKQVKEGQGEERDQPPQETINQLFEKSASVLGKTRKILGEEEPTVSTQSEEKPVESLDKAIFRDVESNEQIRDEVEDRGEEREQPPQDKVSQLSKEPRSILIETREALYESKSPMSTQNEKQSSDSNTEIRRLKKRLREMEKSVKEMDKLVLFREVENDGYKNTIEDLEKINANLEDSIIKCEKRTQEAEDSKFKLEERIDELMEENEQAEKSVEEAKLSYDKVLTEKQEIELSLAEEKKANAELKDENESLMTLVNKLEDQVFESTNESRVTHNELHDKTEKLKHSLVEGNKSNAQLQERVKVLITTKKQVEESAKESKELCDKVIAEKKVLERSLAKEKEEKVNYARHVEEELKTGRDQVKELTNKQQELERALAEEKESKESDIKSLEGQIIDLERTNNKLEESVLKSTRQVMESAREARSTHDELICTNQALARSLAEGKNTNAQLEEQIEELMAETEQAEELSKESKEKQQELEHALAEEKESRAVEVKSFEEQIMDLMKVNDKYEKSLLKSTRQVLQTAQEARTAYDKLLCKNTQLERSLAEKKNINAQLEEQLEEIMGTVEQVEESVRETKEAYDKVSAEKEELKRSLVDEKESKANDIKNLEVRITGLMKVNEKYEKSLLKSTKQDLESARESRVTRNEMLHTNQALMRSLAEGKNTNAQLEEQFEEMMTTSVRSEEAEAISNSSYEEIVAEKEVLERSLESKADAIVNLKEQISCLMMVNEKYEKNLLKSTKQVLQSANEARNDYDQLLYKNMNLEQTLTQGQQIKANLEDQVTKLTEEIKTWEENMRQLQKKHEEASAEAKESYDAIVAEKQESERSLAQEKESKVQLEEQIIKLRSLNSDLEKNIVETTKTIQHHDDIIAKKIVLERSLAEEKEVTNKLEETVSQLKEEKKAFETDTIEFEERLNKALEDSILESVHNAKKNDEILVEKNELLSTLDKEKKRKNRLKEQIAQLEVMNEKLEKGTVELLSRLQKERAEARIPFDEHTAEMAKVKKALREANASKAAVETKLEDVQALNAQLEENLDKSTKFVTEAKDARDMCFKEISSIQTDLSQERASRAELEDRVVELKESKKSEVGKVRKLWKESIDLNDQLKYRVSKLEEIDRLQERETYLDALQKKAKLSLEMTHIEQSPSDEKADLGDIMKSMNATAQQIKSP